MQKIKIGEKLVGDGESCFIIAEAGVNHNGDINLAKKMIDAAKEAGADAIKFQTFKAEKLVSPGIKAEKYQKESGKKDQFEILKELELSWHDFKNLKDYCDKRNIIFLSTPYDEESADFLEKLGVPAFKISSSDLTHIPLLKYIAKKKLPMVVSTGASFLEEINEAVKAIKSVGSSKIILLHCTALYPTKIEDVNLMAMSAIKNRFKLFLIGYSDHTLGFSAPMAAVALGAVVLEKHFTLDRNLPGPDHKASMEPGELKRMIKLVREVEKLLGSPVKRPLKEEYEDRELGRRSIVAKFEIPKGSVIEKEMLVIKRPGTGISPRYLDKITGRIAKHRIKKDTFIKWSHIK